MTQYTSQLNGKTYEVSPREHKDNRTPEQMKTHLYLWGGSDSFLGGWEHRGRRPSYAFWACESGIENRVERWVRARGDIKRVRDVGSDYRSSTADVHIYVVTDSHPAAKY